MLNQRPSSPAQIAQRNKRKAWDAQSVAVSRARKAAQFTAARDSRDLHAKRTQREADRAAIADYLARNP